MSLSKMPSPSRRAVHRTSALSPAPRRRRVLRPLPGRRSTLPRPQKKRRRRRDGRFEGFRVSTKNEPPVQWSALDEASRLIMWDSVHNSLEAGHLGAQEDRVVLHLDHFFLPEKLACALVHLHKLQQRSHRPPPPFPHPAELVFTPRQLQRFPRSCVLLPARRLFTTAGSFATRNSFWIDRIVVRFSSGLVKKVEVRPPKGELCMCI